MGSRLNLESLEVWTTKKLRGFKRANPAVMGNASVRTNLPVNGARNQKQRSPPSPSPPASLVPSPATSPDTPTAPQAEISQPEKENVEFPNKYCMGRCNYEERTGKQCKFLHKKAPLCRMGMNCSRFKCMFSHPKLTRSGPNPCLGNSRQNSAMMNQSQWGPIINPWMVPFQNQLMTNPWNHQHQNIL